jgi:NitT/TauT family transport system substrate-binding protein
MRSSCVRILVTVVALAASACSSAAPAPPTAAPTAATAPTAPAAKPTTAAAPPTAPTTAAAPTTAPAPTAPAAAAKPAPTTPPTAAPAATAAPKPANAPLQKLSVAYSNVSADDLSSWVAKEADIYGQNGLDVDLQLVSGGSKTTAALLSGQEDLTLQGGGEVLSASASGADLVVLASLAPVYPYLFEVSGDIKTIDDLRGKKVGVSSPGGSSDIASRVALKKQGLDPETDVTFVPVDSHANRTAALISGAIQAGVDDPPDSYAVERQGLHPLFDLAALKLPAANTVLVGQRAWVSANRETTQKFVDSLVLGIARMRADKPFTVGVLKKYFQSDDEDAMSGAYDFFTREVTPAVPMPRPEQFADAVAILGDKNEKVKTVDLSRIVDPSFVQSAVDRGLSAH